MRLIVILPLAAIAILAACNSADKPKSPEEVKQEMARMERPEPGLYRTDLRIISFEVPGMPPAQAERMKAIFTSTGKAREYCLTKAEADKGWEVATKKLAEGNCKYDRFNAGNGSLDARLTCQTGRDMTSTIEMNGTMTSTGSQMKMTIVQAAPQLSGGNGGIRMVAETSSQRVGDCPAGTK
jgi:hypothetical protein